mmetsp:Transcript_2993/g.7119  ORF Transcript_2993/g.7119 Transcript_2993/m.7119 type:complete len:299 (+) Transcript_2993:70-966(+)
MAAIGATFDYCAVELVSIALFTLSTPVFFGFVEAGYNHHVMAVLNSYAFSFGMIGLYVWPFCSRKWGDALHRATTNWIELSAFTEVVFQIPHILVPQWLDSKKGSIIQWPWVAYSVCDNRWKMFKPVPAVVDAININDAVCGVLVLLAMYRSLRDKCDRSKATFVTLVLFRDATLFRETVEYMWDHYTSDYKHTLQSTENLLDSLKSGDDHIAGGLTGTHHVILGLPIHQHARVCLWLVNILWLIAPILTLEWAIRQHFVDDVDGEAADDKSSVFHESSPAAKRAGASGALVGGARSG